MRRVGSTSGVLCSHACRLAASRAETSGLAAATLVRAPAFGGLANLLVLANLLLMMLPYEGMSAAYGAALEAGHAALGERQADLVISDMAPNMSGIRDADQARAMYLAELALELAVLCLADGGSFLVKVFQGEGFDAFLRDLRQRFDKVVTRKPGASRARSRELYLLARGFRSTA